MLYSQAFGYSDNEYELREYYPCEQICYGGACSYKSCSAPQCPGGACRFENCMKPSCAGKLDGIFLMAYIKQQY